jgi:hypothetical protein
MAYKQSPIGKRKCVYSPMQKRGLINETPIKIAGNSMSPAKISVSSSGGATTTVPRAGLTGTTGMNRAFKSDGKVLDDSRRADKERRTQDFNTSPEGRQLSATVTNMARGMSGSKGFEKDGQTFFRMYGPDNEAIDFTKKDYDNAATAYARMRNQTVGRKSLEESRASGGQQASYMNDSTMGNQINLAVGGGPRRNVKLDRQPVTPYTGPQYASTDYYNKLDEENKAKYITASNFPNFKGKADQFGFILDDQGRRDEKSESWRYR